MKWNRRAFAAGASHVKSTPHPPRPPLPTRPPASSTTPPLKLPFMKQCHRTDGLLRLAHLTPSPLPPSSFPLPSPPQASPTPPSLKSPCMKQCDGTDKLSHAKLTPPPLCLPLLPLPPPFPPCHHPPQNTLHSAQSSRRLSRNRRAFMAGPYPAKYTGLGVGGWRLGVWG